MFSGDKIATYINVGILAYFALAAIIEMLFGLKRGWKRQLTHICFSAVGIIGAFFITKLILGSIKIDEATIETALSSLPQMDGETLDLISSIVRSMEPELLEIVLKLPASTIIAPLLFTAVFIALNLILKIICLIVNVFVPKARRRSSRLIGMAIGLIEGAAVAAFILLPVCAYSTMAEETAVIIDESDMAGTEDIKAAYNNYVSPLSKNPVVKVTGFIGGNAIINSLANAEVDNKTVNMRDELIGAVRIAAGSQGISEINWAKLSENDKKLLDEYVSSITDSTFYTYSFAGVFRAFATVYEKGEVGSVVDESAGALIGELVHDAIGVLGTSDHTTVSEDLVTIKEMFFILSDGDVVTATNAFMDGEINQLRMIETLNTPYGDTTVLGALIDTLRTNARTDALVETMTRLALSVMSELMSLGEEAAMIYDNVMTGLDTVNNINPESYSTPDEYKAAIEDTISQTLTDNGITVDPEILDDLANHAIDLKAHDDHLDESDIQDVLMKYFDAYK